MSYDATVCISTAQFEEFEKSVVTLQRVPAPSLHEPRIVPVKRRDHAAILPRCGVIRA